MKASTFERILMIAGVILIVGYLASMYVEGFSAYSESIRLIAIIGIVGFGAYNFWIQRQDQKEIYAAEQLADKLQQQLADSKRQVSQLNAEVQKLNQELKQSTAEAEALQDALTKANAALEAQAQRESE